MDYIAEPNGGKKTGDAFTDFVYILTMPIDFISFTMLDAFLSKFWAFVI